ncbi:hypothetical protein V6N13_139695 [Hibiscus sabdariffa]
MFDEEEIDGFKYVDEKQGKCSSFGSCRSSRTTLSEVLPLDQPHVVVDDCIQPNSPLAASLDIVDDTNQIEHIDLPPDIASVLPYEKHVKGADRTVAEHNYRGGAKIQWCC